MKVLKRKTEEEKAAVEAERERRAEEQRAEQASKQAFVATLPRYEYQVKRVGEDKQKGLLGSQRMEEIFNGEGKQGWELVMINEERATFRRQLPPQ